ncbi:MAG: NYN domain-containing protein [Phyllobacterium sp.]
MSRQQQTIFLIDGSHYDRLRSVFETPFDLNKLAEIANDSAAIDRTIYYRDIRDDKEEERQRPLFGWLKYNGFSVKGRTHSPDEPRERYGTNLVQLAVDALLLAESGDHVIILAGDTKLEPLLAAMRDDNIKVTLISTLDAPDTIAPAPILTEASNTFVDLATIIEQLAVVKPTHQ